MRTSSTGGGAHAGPVFVDGSGGRRRLVRRLGVGLAMLSVGYAATMVVLAVVGVHIDAPGLPLPERTTQNLRARLGDAEESRAGSHANGTSGHRTTAAPDAGASDPSTLARAGSTAATPPTPSPSQAGTDLAPASAAPSSTAADSPAAGPTVGTAQGPSATPTATASANNGKSATAPGASHRPSPSSNGSSTDAPGHTRQPSTS